MKLSQKTFHLAGVIPVAGQPLDFNFPWHDCLQPVAPDYLAIEQAVVECGMAGCRTIWIVCNDDMQPLIRHRLGDYVYDYAPLKEAQYRKVPDLYYKEIPIFYVPISPDDRDKRDCLTWSLIHGAYVADYTMRTLSRWVSPRKFFVSWPYGMNHALDIFKYRARLVTDNKVIFTYNDRTAADGDFLPFTFTLEDVRRWKNTIREKGTGKYEMDYSETAKAEPYNFKLRPMADRYSARFFDLQDVIEFEGVEEEDLAPLPWFYNIDSWEGYCEYISSEERKRIKRAPPSMLKYHEFNPVGKDPEESS